MTQTKNKKQRVIKKSEFIRLLAVEAQFSLGDTRIFWKTIEELFARAIEHDIVLNLSGFGKLYVQDIPAKKGAWNPFTQKRFNRPASKRIVFRVSSTFKNRMKEADEEEGYY